MKEKTFHGDWPLMRAFGYNNMERSKIFIKGKVSERFDFQANTREKVTLKTDVVCSGRWLGSMGDLESL